MTLVDPRRRQDLVAARMELVRRRKVLNADGTVVVDPWVFQPHQAPPPPEANARDFWLFGGRNSGKTWAAARHFYTHMMDPTPCSRDVPGGHRGVIVAPSLADAVRSCVEAPSGLKSVDPRVQMVTRPGGTVVVFPNGAEAVLIGLPNARAVSSLRAASNRCTCWLEEFAAIPPLGAALDQLRLSVRMGPRAGLIGSSTPRPRPAVRVMVNDPRAFVRTGRTADNIHADPEYVELLYQRYKGTSVEAQELEGLLLDTVEGALWSHERLDQRRIILGDLPQALPTETREEWLTRVLGLQRIAVAIDPATSGKGDETGLVVVGATAGKRRTRQCFILEDRTALLTPDRWSEVAADMARRWRTPLYVVESNRLGNTARIVLQSVTGTATRVLDPSASVSKGMRADPVSAVWGRQCWIVGHLPKLENEMTSWVPADGDDPDTDFDSSDPEAFRGSPDALDAMVHGVNEMLGLETNPKGRPASKDLTGAWERGWQGG